MKMSQKILIICDMSDVNQSQFVETMTNKSVFDVRCLTSSNYAPVGQKISDEYIFKYNPWPNLPVDSGIKQIALQLNPVVKRHYNNLHKHINPDVVLTLGVTKHLFFTNVVECNSSILLPQGAETARATVTPNWTNNWLKKGVFRVVYRPLFKQLLSHVDEVWTAAPNRDTFVDLGLPEERFRAFDWGEVDTDLFRPRDDAVEFVDDPKTTVIGCFRRIRGHALERSYGLFIDAVAALAERRDDFHVVIGGFYPDGRSDHMEGFIDDRIAARGVADRITKVGMVPKTDLPRYLSGLDVYVDLPHEFVLQGTGTASKEAMAAGCAFVTYDRPDMPLRYAIPEDAGVLISYDEPETMVDELESLCAHPDRSANLGERARQHMIERFSQEAVAARVEDILREVVG